MGRIGQFIKGGLFGILIGAIIGLLIAPESGAETRKLVADRIQKVRRAGADAEAAKKQEYVQRYRVKTHDNSALTKTEQDARAAHAEQLRHIEATRPTF